MLAAVWGMVEGVVGVRHTPPCTSVVAAAHVPKDGTDSFALSTRSERRIEHVPPFAYSRLPLAAAAEYRVGGSC